MSQEQDNKNSVVNSLITAENKTASTISLIVGAILFVGGLISVIMRGELLVNIVGKEQILKEAFWGGSSAQDTLTIITIISAIAMIIGLVLLILGIKKTIIQK